MNKHIFFSNDKATLTVMLQADNPDRIKELMDKSAPEGAEAFGIQLEQLEGIYRTREVYKDIFAYAKDKPLYVTNYRDKQNSGKSDDELAELANCGRDILFSACNWGADDSKNWMKSTGAHIWRMSGDVHDNWQSISDIYRQQIEMLPYNSTSCFNDMDMLVVGMNSAESDSIETKTVRTNK